MNNESKIQDINLTEDDFKMIFDALERMPDRSPAESVAGSVIGALMPEGKMRDDFEKKMVESERKRQIEHEILTENVRLLQGKIIMLKRHLIENDLMGQVKKHLQ